MKAQPAPDAPKPGRYFLHRVYIDFDNLPILCRITAIRRGMVYYRPQYVRPGGRVVDGHSTYFNSDRYADSIGRYVDGTDAIAAAQARAQAVAAQVQP